MTHCASQVAYFGPAAAVMDYLATVGLHCSVQCNPADFASKLQLHVHPNFIHSAETSEYNRRVWVPVVVTNGQKLTIQSMGNSYICQQVYREQQHLYFVCNAYTHVCVGRTCVHMLYTIQWIEDNLTLLEKELVLPYTCVSIYSVNWVIQNYMTRKLVPCAFIYTYIYYVGLYVSSCRGSLVPYMESMKVNETLEQGT